jgi:hypothetical protein
VRYGAKIAVQEVLSQSSYLSANDPRLHFGTGDCATVDVEVRWPLGAVEKFPGVSVNQLIQVTEGSGITKTQRFG